MFSLNKEIYFETNGEMVLAVRLIKKSAMRVVAA